MQNFQDTFETRKRSFISAFSICMTVPLTLVNYFCKNLSILKLYSIYKTKQHTINYANKRSLKTKKKLKVT